MPFTVTCPHCSSPLRIRDEYAGRAMKCPTCQGTIPAAVTKAGVDAPPKPATRPTPPADEDAPRTPSKRRPRDEDDEDDRPRSKRRARDEDDDDEEEAPRSKRRSRDEDDEEDRPRSRRRKSDQTKKKGGLGLILGILGGVFVLCGGGCAGVYFGFIKPKVDQVQDQMRAENDRKELEIAEARKQMQRPGQPANNKPAEPSADQAPAATLTADELAANPAKYRGKTIVVTGTVEEFSTAGGVDGFGTMTLRGGNKGRTYINCSFSRSFSATPPKLDDQVEIRGEVSATSNEIQVALFKCALAKPPAPGKPATPKPDAPKPPSDDKAIEITAEDLLAEYARDDKAAAEKYRNKVVKVTGEVKQTTASAVMIAGKAEGGFTYAVSAMLPFEQRGDLTALKPGAKVAVTGKPSLFATRNTAKTKTLLLTDGRLVK